MTRTIKRILRERSITAGMEFAVGNSMTGELGFNIGSSETRTSQTSVEKVQANSIETTFQPLPFEKYVAEGSFGTQYAKVPVSMRVQCIRKEGGFEEATLDAVLKTMGMTFISVKYEDRTNTCPQSYYRNCECVPNMSSQFVGSGCTTHPKFDGAEGCYVYKGRGSDPTCTNGMSLGTATPRDGVEDMSNSWDYGVDGVNFGWSYRACGGAQYYPGDKDYKGVQYGDLIWMKPGHACQWGEGGTLSEVPYSSKNYAVEACYNRNLQKKNTCLGVYDARCDDTGSFYLCSVKEELTRSGQGSCVWTML